MKFPRYWELLIWKQYAKNVQNVELPFVESNNYQSSKDEVDCFNSNRMFEAKELTGRNRAKGIFYINKGP